MKILHLILTYHWFDQIITGRKPEEYRDMKWIKRICRKGSANGQRTYCAQVCPTLRPECCQHVPTDYTHVCFHRGYTKALMYWSIDNITIGKGNPQWGAPDDKPVVIIRLLKREGGQQ